MRLNRFISSTGLCSRREADKLIEEKRVGVNGQVATLGVRVGPNDQVTVDGEIIEKKVEDIYIAFHKPVGVICTTERHVKGNIIDFINYPERIFPIGRLDKDSEGLILLTNDGGIVNEILREENNHSKEYMVVVNKVITPAFIKGMTKGVKIYNPVRECYTITKRCEIKQIDPYTFKITLSQGLNRQIRRMCAHFGYQVMKLKRIKVMDITLEHIEVGKWRYLTREELGQVRQCNS